VWSTKSVNSEQTMHVLNIMHSFGKIEHIVDKSSSATKAKFMIDK